MAPVLQHHPDLSQIHILQADKEKELLDKLKVLGFDAIIDLHSNWRTLMWKFQLAPPGSGIPFLRFRKNNVQKWWTVQTKRKPSRYLHTVEKYEKMLKSWDIQDDGQGLDWAFDPSLGSKPNEISFLKQEFGWDPDQQVTAIALGAHHATKCLPKDQLIALCHLLEGPILLLGGSQDKDLAEQLIENLDRKDIAHGCGRCTLQQSAKVLSECTCLITPDTGLMHIGAALRIKLFVIWGNTIPEFGMHPWLPNHAGRPLRSMTQQAETLQSANASSMADLHLPEHFEVEVSCRPCSKLGHPSCPQGHFQCMMGHDVHRIAEAVQRYRLSCANPSTPPVHDLRN